MANKEFKDVSTNQTGLVHLDGYIALDSSAAIVAGTSVLLDMTAVKTTTGVYTVTLSDPWLGIVSVQPTLTANATGIAKLVEVGQVTTGATPTIVLRTVAVGTGAVADVTAACGIFLHVVCKNSSVR
jgi:hypothetical protein